MLNWNANKQAKLEGWIIKFHNKDHPRIITSRGLSITPMHQTLRVYRWEIAPGYWLFPSDKQAWAWVCMRADKGSEFHQRAVAVCVASEIEAAKS